MESVDISFLNGILVRRPRVAGGDRRITSRICADRDHFKKRLLLPKVIVYDNAGHIPHEEIPEQAVVDALDFVK